MTNTDKLFLSSYIVKRAQPAGAQHYSPTQSFSFQPKIAEDESIRIEAFPLAAAAEKMGVPARPTRTIISPKSSPASYSMEGDRFPMKAGDDEKREQAYLKAINQEGLTQEQVSNIVRMRTNGINNRGTDGGDIRMPLSDPALYWAYKSRVLRGREPAPAPTPAPAPLDAAAEDSLNAVSLPTSVSLPTKDPSQFFRSYMGSNFDPKSRVDRNKLKFLQSLQSEGMNLEDVRGNQADIYKRMKGMRF
jgi:hypothetical protein